MSNLPFPALGQALLAQLEPAWWAGEALRAVPPFACPARAVAGLTTVAGFISVVALRAVLHTGRVCQGRRRVCLGIKHGTYLPKLLCLLPTVSWWKGDAQGVRQCPCGLMAILGNQHEYPRNRFNHNTMRG